jgi:hypothetical protein
VLILFYVSWLLNHASKLKPLLHHSKAAAAETLLRSGVTLAAEGDKDYLS